MSSNVVLQDSRLLSWFVRVHKEYPSLTAKQFASFAREGFQSTNVGPAKGGAMKGDYDDVISNPVWGELTSQDVSRIRRKAGLTHKRVEVVAQEALLTTKGHKEMEEFLKIQSVLDAERCTFIDELSFNLAHTPTKGWARRGERLRAIMPYTSGLKTTVILSMCWPDLDSRCKPYVHFKLFPPVAVTGWYEYLVTFNRALRLALRENAVATWKDIREHLGESPTDPLRLWAEDQHPGGDRSESARVKYMRKTHRIMLLPGCHSKEGGYTREAWRPIYRRHAYRDSLTQLIAAGQELDLPSRVRDVLVEHNDKLAECFYEDGHALDYEYDKSKDGPTEQSLPDTGVREALEQEAEASRVALEKREDVRETREHLRELYRRIGLTGTVVGAEALDAVRQVATLLRTGSKRRWAGAKDIWEGSASVSDVASKVGDDSLWVIAYKRLRPQMLVNLLVETLGFPGGTGLDAGLRGAAVMVKSGDADNVGSHVGLVAIVTSVLLGVSPSRIGDDLGYAVSEGGDRLDLMAAQPVGLVPQLKGAKGPGGEGRLVTLPVTKSEFNTYIRSDLPLNFIEGRHLVMDGASVHSRVTYGGGSSTQTYRPGYLSFGPLTEEQRSAGVDAEGMNFGLLGGRYPNGEANELQVLLDRLPGLRFRDYNVDEWASDEDVSKAEEQAGQKLLCRVCGKPVVSKRHKRTDAHRALVEPDTVVFRTLRQMRTRQYRKRALALPGQLTLVYTPAYQPQFNPIEKIVGYLKRTVRKMPFWRLSVSRLVLRRNLSRALHRALHHIDPANVINTIICSGYVTQAARDRADRPLDGWKYEWRWSKDKRAYVKAGGGTDYRQKLEAIREGVFGLTRPQTEDEVLSRVSASIQGSSCLSRQNDEGMYYIGFPETIRLDHLPGLEDSLLHKGTLGIAHTNPHEVGSPVLDPETKVYSLTRDAARTLRGKLKLYRSAHPSQRFVKTVEDGKQVLRNVDRLVCSTSVARGRRRHLYAREASSLLGVGTGTGTDSGTGADADAGADAGDGDPAAKSGPQKQRDAGLRATQLIRDAFMEIPDLDSILQEEWLDQVAVSALFDRNKDTLALRPFALSYATYLYQKDPVSVIASKTGEPDPKGALDELLRYGRGETEKLSQSIVKRVFAIMQEYNPIGVIPLISTDREFDLLRLLQPRWFTRSMDVPLALVPHVRHPLATVVHQHLLANNTPNPRKKEASKYYMYTGNDLQVITKGSEVGRAPQSLPSASEALQLMTSTLEKVQTKVPPLGKPLALLLRTEASLIRDSKPTGPGRRPTATVGGITFTMDECIRVLEAMADYEDSNGAYNVSETVTLGENWALDSHQGVSGIQVAIAAAKAMVQENQVTFTPKRDIIRATEALDL